MKNINDFFCDIDNATLNDPKVLAIEYIKFIEKYYDYTTLEQKQQNIYLVPENEILENVSKKAILVSDSLCLMPNTSKNFMFFRDRSHTISREHCVNINDIIELGTWLKSAKPLFITDKLFYLPQIYIKEESKLSKPFSFTPNNINNKEIIKTLLESASLSFSQKMQFAEQYMNKLLSINIPILDNVSMDDFSNITLENQLVCNNFKNFLTNSLSDINVADKLALEKLSLSLEKQVIDISHSYQKTRDKYLRKISINFLTTITATLFCFTANANSEILEALQTFIGAGASATGFIPITNNFLKYKADITDIKQKECYYLWLLSKKTK